MNPRTRKRGGTGSIPTVAAARSWRGSPTGWSCPSAGRVIFPPPLSTSGLHLRENATVHRRWDIRRRARSISPAPSEGDVPLLLQGDGTPLLEEDQAAPLDRFAHP